MQPLPAVFVRTGRSHWCHGQMAFGLRGRNEKNGGRRKWVDQYVQKKGLNSDTKQLTFNAVLTKGCHHGAGFLLGDDTSLKTTDHFVAICGSMLSSMCLRSMHAWCGRISTSLREAKHRFGAQTFAKRSIVSRFTCWDDCAMQGKRSGKNSERIDWLCSLSIPYHTMGLVYSPTWIVDFLYNPGVISYIIY